MENGPLLSSMMILCSLGSWLNPSQGDLRVGLVWHRRGCLGVLLRLTPLVQSDQLLGVIKHSVLLGGCLQKLGSVVQEKRGKCSSLQHADMLFNNNIPSSN